jgi:2-methylisocitrate lyase-like PEP mutase family enzyme
VLGKLDGHVTREEALEHARAVAAAVDVPVSADLEKGFGHTPEDAARTIRLAAEMGLAGGSIEDASGDPGKPIYDLVLATERIAAAAEAARATGFVLTARAENFLHKRADLDDTLRRLQAFEKAGADVLFAPGLPDLAAVRAACAAVSGPVSFMVAIPGKSFTVAQLAQAGVRRISFATSLYRAAMTGLIAAAAEIRDHGTFGYLERSVASAEIARHMKRD